MFFGGITGGLLYGHWGLPGIAVFCGFSLMAWLFILSKAPPVKLFETRLLHISPKCVDRGKLLAERLNAIPGVMEVTIVAEEGIAYLKIDRNRLDENRLTEFVIS